MNETLVLDVIVFSDKRFCYHNDRAGQLIARIGL